MALRMWSSVLILVFAVAVTIGPVNAGRALYLKLAAVKHDDDVSQVAAAPAPLPVPDEDAAPAPAPAAAPEEAPTDNIITFFMQLHSSNTTAAIRGATNINGGINPQPLTFPAASLPNNNNNGLTIGGAGLLINGGGAGSGIVGTRIIGGGGLITNNGGGIINGNGLGVGVGGLGGGIIPNPATNTPLGSGIPLPVQQIAYPEMITVKQPVFEDPEQESTVIGMAQGYFLPSLQLQDQAEEGHVISMAFTATLTHQEQETEVPSSIQLAGQLKSIDGESVEEGEMIVVGGIGVYQGATGDATVEPVPEHQGFLKFTINFSS